MLAVDQHDCRYLSSDRPPKLPSARPARLLGIGIPKCHKPEEKALIWFEPYKPKRSEVYDVPKGHLLRGATLPEALREDLLLGGVFRHLYREGSAGLCEVLRWFHWILQGLSRSDPMVYACEHGQMFDILEVVDESISAKESALDARHALV